MFTQALGWLLVIEQICIFKNSSDCLLSLNTFPWISGRNGTLSLVG